MVLAAFLLGFLGSFHCIGMCGPIAIALPQHEGQKNLIYTSALLYNIGRVITYSIIGLLFGTIGKGLFIGGFQQIVSIATGEKTFTDGECQKLENILSEMFNLFNDDVYEAAYPVFMKHIASSLDEA